MIICFEGAPAVGKSTIANKILEDGKHLIIPEVNNLFGKENRISNEWYYERQIERWSIATYRNTDKKPVILDGDVFQPIWFQWIYPNFISGDFNQIVEFYREKIRVGEIEFPDVYVLLHLDDDERVKREISRSKILGKTNQQIRNKVNRYKDLAEAQRKYFNELERIAPGLVIRIETSSISSSVEKVLSISKGIKLNTADVFESMVNWCTKNGCDI